MPELSPSLPANAPSVLVVDDHVALRRLVGLALRRQYRVREAGDAAEALAAIAAERPDVIILDVMMPGETDGFALCRRIKALPGMQAVHIVMVTARGQQNDIALGSAAGADAYFVKPFSPLALLTHLDTACRGREKT
ncbi:PleD family two-component system response regulator [Massilia sp. X63]|uniref:response regulator n=1 Tax=Massilia sp. X63 TaxID=3237285 RepID=UPI0034DD082F